MEHKFNYNWTLKDAIFTKDKGKVFSCFACGGGSTMGYKLAGFDVIGCNEIDIRVMNLYESNHHPRYKFLEPIQTFKERTAFPEALYNLDILDGSPPCSAFSIAGSREEDKSLSNAGLGQTMALSVGYMQSIIFPARLRFGHSKARIYLRNERTANNDSPDSHTSL